MKPAVRLSLGIVALTLCVLVAADSLLGIFPDSIAPALDARKKLAESLGIQYATIEGKDEFRKLVLAMEATVAQKPDVLSMGLRTNEGELVASTKDHRPHWLPEYDGRSTPTHMRIPMFRGEERWGSLEVRFAPLPATDIRSLLAAPLYKLVLVMGAVGFAVYMLYLRRTLRHLDPSSVVPGRVRAALDQLVEGAFILDRDQRIVLVNAAFAEKVGQSPESLLGVDPSTLKWATNGDGGEANPHPWSAVTLDGARRHNVRLELETPKLGVRVLTSNVSPILDGSGKHRGVLATFDDISEVERMNKELQDTVERLELAQVEVRQKNEELVRLATIDPLTGSLNRRALFDKLELEFAVARRETLDFSVVMADIDHFKRVNDDFGHAAGDAVIKEMAAVLGEFVGQNGCAGRYGGEEFCLALVATDLNAAADIANSIRVEFARRSSLSSSPTQGQRVTASFGVSCGAYGAPDLAELLDQADQALYRSKHDGRDRVTIYADVAVPRREVS